MTVLRDGLTTRDGNAPLIVLVVSRQSSLERPDYPREGGCYYRISSGSQLQQDLRSLKLGIPVKPDCLIEPQIGDGAGLN